MTTPKPSEAELRILHVLWDRGPSTVREVHGTIEKTINVGYTTTLKLMQIMLEKGLLQRDESVHRHIYTALPTREKIQERFVDDLVDSLFHGSKKRLVLQVLADSTASQKELDEIRDAIREFENNTTKKRTKRSQS